MKLRSILTAAALSLLPHVAPAMPKDSDEVILWLIAEVEISAEGKLDALQWKNTNAATQVVASRVEPVVRGWTFEPGTVNGVRQPTVTHLTLRLHAKPVGESFVIRVGSASTGAKASLPAFPQYPYSAVRDGADAVLLADVAVAADGTVSVEDVEIRTNRPAYRKQFVQSAKAAIAQWTLVPERVGGRPLATRMQVPFTFCVTTPDCASKYPMPKRALDQDQAGPPGQPVALESAVRLIDSVAGRAL